MADSTCILILGILYIEINHLRKAEPIQLYQILNKGKALKNSKHVLFIIFLKSEAKFDKLCVKKQEKSIPYLLNLLSFVPNNSNLFTLAQLSFLRITQKWQLPANVFKLVFCYSKLVILKYKHNITSVLNDIVLKYKNSFERL